MTIAERLRNARGRRTQREVADLLGVTQPTIHAWESGKTTPRAQRLRQVAAVYGVSLKHLVPEAA